MIKKSNKVDINAKNISFFSLFYNMKATFFLTILFLFIEGITQILIPFLISKLIDLGLTKLDIEQTKKYALILAGVALIALTFGLLRGFFLSKGSTLLAKNLRYKLFSHVQEFSFKEFDKFSTGAILNRLNNDITNIQNSYNFMMIAFFRAPILIIGPLVLAIISSPTLSIVFAVSIPAFVVLVLVSLKFVAPLFRMAFKEYDKYNLKIQENIANIKTIKSYATLDFEANKVEAINKKVRNFFIKIEKILAFNQPIFFGIVFGALAFIGLYGVNLIRSQSSDVMFGDILSFSAYIWQITTGLTIFIAVIGVFFASFPSWKRNKEVLSLQSSLSYNENSKLKINNGSVKFENVSFKYDEADFKYALENINLEIKAGQSLGIIGETASGKSTLISLIARLYDPTEGQVKIDDNDLKNYSLNEIRDNISLVLQKTNLFSGTIKENLKWASKDLTLEQMQKATKIAQINDFINSLDEGFDHKIEQKGNNFSGGQKQRISIARALLKNPKILILDDATSAIDFKTESQIKKALDSEINNLTKIIISQKISSLKDLDSIIVLQNGKILAQGSHKYLLENCKWYFNLNESQKTTWGNLDE
ncbi:ABC transporter ATP-binding protein [Mycoplasmopsis synoviae]|uniref:Putative ABC transporter, ATP-binding protein n=2 Tax=Mycoplasmopsis synoviae TaxID=2109 RepID=Q4A5Q0_MYCS5|nr:ABC transporter ATP-binding protein [Mycoplasmopsis synoviae]AAZ43921.2 putative ABC transporter, ATP-binding protein [Mycoplasmopsis synoviae 53]